ncbi:hypothetical protein [Noviherbaspirillum malthae]|uniref:hypothetical protein n=1 Tax=Noviherbaspirillum malthae TaxID=1260987 RepID=UPI00188EB88C|nr:hypothetical protein [Noviherbaspirillum malthae]
MFARIFPSPPQSAHPIGGSSMELRSRPVQNQPPHITLPSNVQLDNERAISTGKPRVTYAHWHGRNTLDLGAVNEDVQGITLSGQHTFPDQAIETALEALRLYPGHNLYLGIPPANPQKYVLVQNDVLSRDAQASPIVIPLNVRPQQDHSQGSEIGRGNRTPRNCGDYLLRAAYKANRKTLGSGSPASNNPAVAREQHPRRTHEERAVELRHIGQELQRGVEGIGARYGDPSARKRHPNRSGGPQTASSSRLQPSGPQHESAPSSSFPTLNSPESIQGPLRTLNAGYTPKRTLATSVRKADLASSASSLSRDTNEVALGYGTNSFNIQDHLGRSFTQSTVGASQQQRCNQWKEGLRNKHLHNLQRPGEIASSGTARMFSRKPGLNKAISFAKITSLTSRDAAAAALQRVISTFPELSGELQQQRWVDLLNKTSEAYAQAREGYERAKKGKRMYPALSILEEAARELLRQLLEVSSITNVFNFDPGELPTSIEALDLFANLPQFRMFIEGVNEAYQRMAPERLESGADMEPDNSARAIPMS